MGRSQAQLIGNYEAPEGLLAGWRSVAADLGARESVAGFSVEGRPIHRFDVGRPDGKPVLLTALIHGLEVIGSIGLLRALTALRNSGAGREVLQEMRLTVLPICNPDAFAQNMDRLARGRFATRRTNRHGVDLNRNFPLAGRAAWLHPFSGSRFRISPYYRGAAPLSEPETQTVARVAREIRPQLALGFHSFGNMVLYPWAFSKQPNLRVTRYRDLAASFSDALPTERYQLRQASSLYPTLGDLDDWLDAEFGTLALTVEVGNPNRRLWHPLRLLNPFCWMNPFDVDGTVRNLAPGLGGMLWHQAVAPS